MTLRLPRHPTPAWFVDRLDLRRGQKIVVVDDDETIHKMWQKRLQRSGADACVSLTHVYTAETAHSEWYWLTFLVDYHLDGFGLNGIEFIEKAGALPRAVLTTSAAEDPALQARCAKLGLKLLSKQHAGTIAIRMP